MADNEKLNPLEELAAYHANAPRFMKGSPFVNNRDEFNDVTNWIPSEQNRPYDTGRQDENGNPIMDSPVNDAFRVEDAPVNAGKSAGTILVEGLQSLRQEENDPLKSLAGKPLFATMGNFASGLVPEGFKESKLYADYFYGADEKREAIAHATELYRQGLIKVNPEALGLASSEQQRKLWESMMKQVHFVEKLQNLKDIPGTTDESGKVDMRKVLAQFPEIKDVLEQKGTNAAVLALMEAKHIKKIDEVYSNEFTRFFGSVATGAERGVYSFVKQAVGAKAALGAMLGNRNKDAFTKDEQAILSDMDKRLSGLAENSYTGVGSAVGGAIGAALENAPLVVTSVIGTYLGGAAAVAAGASAPVATAAGSALAIGLMGIEIGGSQYEQNASKRDKSGRRMYTPEQAGYLSMTQGIAEGVLEQYTLKQIGKAMTGRPAMKELADLYSNAAIKDLALVAGKGATEAELKAQTYALVKQTLKDMANAGVVSFKTELFEEFSQQVSDMVIENAFQLALKGEAAELSSMQEILSQSIYAAAEAVPAVVGFGMFGMAGHGVAHRKQLTSPRQYIGSLRDSLVQNVMNNQHLTETIEGVGANLKNIEELQGKAPDVVQEILDSNNARYGIKDSYLDIKTLKQEEGGAELVEAIAKQAGISAEELQACEAGTGILKVGTSVLMQVSSTAQDKAKGILFRNVTKESTMKTNKQAEEEIENIKQALAILNGKADIDADEAVKKYVDGMFQDQAQAQKAMEILRADIENPHAELKKRLKAVQGEIDAELETTIKQLQNGIKQGVDISNSAQWYQNWFADNKKEITKADLERIAYENATGQATRYADGVTNDGSPEAQQYFSEAKAKLDGLMAERDTLQSLAPSLKWIQKGDVIAASTLTAEAVNVYRQVKETLLQGNKNVSSAAAASALLFARQAERAARYHQEAGEKDYTAQDYLMQIVADAQGNGLGLQQSKTKKQPEIDLFDILPQEKREEVIQEGKDLANTLDYLREHEDDSDFDSLKIYKICSTPDLFYELGYKADTISIRAKDLLGVSKISANNWHANHAIFADILKQIPQKMHSPLCIMDSVKVSGRKVAVLDFDIKDEHGAAAKLFIPLSVNAGTGIYEKGGNQIIAHIATSIYPRSLDKIANDISKILEKNLLGDYSEQIRYLSGDKKKTASISPTRVQFPVRLINDSLSLRERISQKYKPVNDNLDQKPAGRSSKTIKGAYSQSQNLIALFQAADQSTFMHESAHAYLEDLRKLAEQFPESQAAKDYATIMAWAQWKEGDAAAYVNTASEDGFADLEAEIKEALKNGFVERTVQVNGQEQTIRLTADELKAEWAQERFARGFEVYLQSGTAPSSTLVRAFSRFKSWLTRIYKDVTGAGVRASSEVEAIMARMVAADDEIENYALVKRAQRIQDIDADLLDTDTQAMLQRWEDQAKEDAKAKLLAQLIKEFKEADTKKHMDDYKKQLEDMARDMDVFKAEAVAKVSGEQAVVAMGFYKSVTDYQQDLALHDGGYNAFIDTELKAEAERYKQQLPNAADLQQRAEDAYNSGNYATQLAALEAEILGRRIEKYANAPKKLAAAMDDVEQALAQEDKPLEKAILALKYAFRWETKQAEKIALLQDLVEELKQASKEDRQKIKDEMTAKVKELKAETMQNKAWLRGVRDAAVGKAKAHREAAKQRLSNMSIREATNTRAWIREADKAGKQCLKAITAAVSSKDDAAKQAKYKEAQDAKIRQSVYTAMAAESVRLKRTSQRLIVQMKQRAKAAPKNKRLDAINKYYLGHTLYMFGMKPADNLKPTGLQPLQDVLKNLAVQGFDCNVDQAILQEAGGTQPSRSYSDLNITELAEVADLVDFLYVSGVNLGKLLTTEEYLPDVVTKLLQAHDEATALEQDRKAREKDGINDYMLQLLKPEVMLRLLDSKQGLFVKYIYQPLFEGQDKKRVLSEQSAEQLKTILDNWLPSEQRKELTEVWETLFDGQELTKENIIAMALNWGNKANRQRLLAGLNYGKETTERFVQEADVLEVFDKHMVKADWEFVQQIWDYIGQYGDDVNQVVQDCTGNPMDRVQADPFDILSADGERISLKGGYYPIKRDPSKSSVQQELEVQNQASSGQVLGMSMGSTKSRAKGDVAMGPLLLEMGVISRHVDQQIHIITMRKACLDAYRLLRQTQVANAITQQFGEKSHRILLKWVEDVWHEPMGENDILSGWGERLRGNTIKAIMAYRVSTAMLNFANVVPMADRLGVANTVKALLQFMANPRQMREFVMQDSAFMRDRANNLDRDLRTQQSKMLGSNKYMDAIDKYSNWLIAETDLLCGVPTYNWAYQESYSKAIAEGASAAEAAKRARFDAHEAVRSVLGSADSIDQAAVQRSKSLFIKALTPFYSFFNAQMNAVWVKYYEGRYGGQTIVTTDPAGNVTRTPVKEAFMKRYSGFMYSLLMRHVLMAGIETCIRTGLDVLSAGHDDRPEKDPWARFIKQWSINSVDSAVGGFPALNGAVSACFYALMGENKMASRGVTDAAVERMIKPFVKAGEAAGRGKSIDPLEYARMTTKGIGGSVFGIPDTLTDGVFNTARFLLDDYRLMDPADLREYIGRTLLDKRLKAKDK